MIFDGWKHNGDELGATAYAKINGMRVITFIAKRRDPSDEWDVTLIRDDGNTIGPDFKLQSNFRVDNIEREVEFRIMETDLKYEFIHSIFKGLR